MPSMPEVAALARLIEHIRALLSEVREERRRLHIERHAILQIVIRYNAGA